MHYELIQQTGRQPVELIIVTGMSGAGKSQAVDALEDMGFY
jgi:predicted ATPase